METLILDLKILFFFTVIIVLVKVIIPTISYGLRLSLWIALGAMIVFSVQLFNLAGELDLGNDEDAWRMVYSALFLILFAVYIAVGFIKGQFKTETIVLSRVKEVSVGTMKSGLNWIDRAFEKLSLSIDLRKIPVYLDKTPELQTSARGIKALVKEISFMMEKDGDAKEILLIEGGFNTIKKRVLLRMNEYFIHKVGILTPNDLDTDKGTTIEDMVAELTNDLNDFCEINEYPYTISEILIGDTELDEAYYKALAKIVIAGLNKDAAQIDADALLARLKSVGSGLLPNTDTYSDADRLKAAQVSLGIVKEEFQFKKFGIDLDNKKEVTELVLAIAKLFKKA